MSWLRLNQQGHIYGIDCFENSVNAAKEKGIKAFLCDLEKDKFPFEDNYFDIVIANQVFEHLKQIYMPLTEIHRVIKPNGYLLFGVPNLASLHSRLLLSIGKQPTCIQMFDEHIRAFTPNTLIEFLTFNNLFQLVRFKGLGFYPLIPPFSDIFSKIFPKASVIMLILLKKNVRQGVTTWQEEVQRLVKQTNY
ncbi:MAG: class I SAM-dependent methyltransferase [Planctomycetia bacterium]|nr:class I SAM-dependent methyltransferase [Planctomycetia bacterium]